MHEQGLATISASIISWLMVGHGLFNNNGPPFFGSSEVFFSSLDVDGSALAPIQAAVLALAATAALGAVADRVTVRASLLLSFIITGIVVPITARTVWHATGVNLLC